jgi:hypothetical protein
MSALNFQAQVHVGKLCVFLCTEIVLWVIALKTKNEKKQD